MVPVPKTVFESSKKAWAPQKKGARLAEGSTTQAPELALQSLGPCLSYPHPLQLERTLLCSSFTQTHFLTPVPAVFCVLPPRPGQSPASLRSLTGVMSPLRCQGPPPASAVVEDQETRRCHCERLGLLSLCLCAMLALLQG